MNAPEIVIAGAGCAGLSLAAELVNQGVDRTRSITLIDPRTEFPRDRTFCFWDVSPHLFSSAVTKRWPKWRVRRDGQFIERGSSRYAYCHLPADTFYRRALSILERSSRVNLELGVSVDDMVEEHDGVRIETTRGVLRASLAFDARTHTERTTKEPDGGRPRANGLVQHFLGLHVRTDRPVFPTTPTLMDFRVDQTRGIHFVYVLPYGPSEALVEDTYFSNTCEPLSHYRENIASYLHDLGANSWTVEHEERGAIPMTAGRLPYASGARLHAIGTRGGLVKPSTGYAFLSIQRFSRELAARLAHEASPALPRARLERHLALDRAMLLYLQDHPTEAPRVFTDLFERVKPEVLVRFLSDVGSVRDDLRVMNASPRTSIVLSSLRHVRQWLP